MRITSRIVAIITALSCSLQAIPLAVGQATEAQRLIEQANSNNPPIAGQALEEIQHAVVRNYEANQGSANLAYLPLLRKLIYDEHNFVYSTACWIIRDMGTDAAAACPDLDEIANHPPDSLRRIWEKASQKKDDSPAHGAPSWFTQEVHHRYNALRAYFCACGVNGKMRSYQGLDAPERFRYGHAFNFYLLEIYDEEPYRRAATGKMAQSSPSDLLSGIEFLCSYAEDSSNSHDDRQSFIGTLGMLRELNSVPAATDAITATLTRISCGDPDEEVMCLASLWLDQE